ncbi:MAG: hypothetical protein A3H72_03125 [Candidatus Doudnabacteria bacterium RIFCSPLOWO2_02_FULL_48_8]|uniref:DUF1003 domain-containing protein n=1 Tax=Candidatus Doudnabacteria bacterium RIFCSPHIGHO2_01_FULL_46_24 TaxID=1817825 RepID=A0A1F5NV71_9BACT|nr:MAG: hypothetical protein A2720_00565 [Candidatus Doudnabacteria bacterium RIFCSPHIGHO2_01_FULL_46_24]OGE95664.1 MAG: hypothetical protein A3H72_03125 [Candidatus Doudnabacteria bacterium RIFCSPLOWO2_02_FULL_48_8]OGE95966.1 MAG: hypothetical protein A3E98_04025 [Candidatus Doudnabacteria bacterium RIFCSPHIGHO2_12_FULL_48_11]
MGKLDRKTFFNLFGFEEVKKREQILRSYKAKADAKRTFAEKLADQMTGSFGSMTFLVLNVIFFTVWLLINTGRIAGAEIFDPFPFVLLTMVVSLEAIFLAIFVLISQNRAAKIEDIREEVELQINIIAEKEVTKLMKMVALLLEKHGIDLQEDQELQKMLKTVSATELEKRLEKEIS